MPSTRFGAAVIASVAITAAAAIAVIAGPRKADVAVGGLSLDAPLPAGPPPTGATLVIGDRIEIATATATGPVAALTAMLHDHGVAVEMLRFHQLQSDDTTATFIQGTDG